MTNKFPYPGHFFQKIRIVSYWVKKDDKRTVSDLPVAEAIALVKAKKPASRYFYHFVPNISGSNLHIAFRPLPLRPEKATGC